MKTMHLFAGIGGGLLADLILGHDPIIAVEWDGYACQVLRERATEGWFPDLRVWEGDVRMFDPSEYAGQVDCIHAGFPCQDISVAGKQAGVSEGTRSGLYREVLRIADTVRPSYLFLENVAAILSNGLGTVLGDLAAMGYDARWCCLRASDVGAAHHRDRWWCLCHAKHAGRNATEITGSIAQGSNDHQAGAKQAKQPTGSSNTEVLADSDSKRGRSWNAEGEDAIPTRESSRHSRSNSRTMGYWDIESSVGRVANGVPNRVHMLKGLGNAQVPLQAAVAWKLLGGK